MPDEKAKSFNKVQKRLQAMTPARVAVGRTGTRPPTDALLAFWGDHAAARDAVKSELSHSFIADFCHEYEAITVSSTVSNRDEFVLFPPLGKKVTPDTETLIKSHFDISNKARIDVTVVISDGLSARAVEENVPDLYPMLLEGFDSAGITYSRPVIVTFGRVAVADQIAHLAGAKIAINLIGERPGLSCASGLSAYITYNPNPETTISSDRTVVSNIHLGGTPAVEAGAFIVKVVERILQVGVSGVKLQSLS